MHVALCVWLQWLSKRTLWADPDLEDTELDAKPGLLENGNGHEKESSDEDADDT
eukprot:SAG22_NODE_815_length_7037_cov_6.192130_6_plen_54_part_00